MLLLIKRIALEGSYARSVLNDKIATKQVIGYHQVAKYSVEIAKFLGKSDAKRYTSHSFRRSAATMRVESDASLSALKAAGGWRSSTVA
jgi:hypothetical protein